jgi:flagellar hook-associated protein 1
MASLLEIGRSAINAQREALNVTGQNIVNANTEGYRKRDANLAEVSGVQSELTALTAQTGLGVQLGEVRRAYDSFLTDSKRTASGRFESSEAFVQKLERLQNTVLPNDGDLGTTMTAFFDTLGQVAARPGDLAPRAAAIEMGRTVSNAFNTTASLLDELGDGTFDEISTRLNDVNQNLSALASVNGKLRSSNLGGNPPNTLLDERDRLIDQLSSMVPVSVAIGNRFEAEVRLGASNGGPIIVTGEDSKVLSAGISDQGNIFFRVGAGQTVSQLETGGLRGLVDAYGTTRRASNELDMLARNFSTGINAQHSQGIDLDSQLGREMFAVAQFSPTAGRANEGTAEATIRLVPGRADSLDRMQMTYTASTDRWILKDDAGTELATGRTRLEIDGAVIDVTGTPEDGDTVTFTRDPGDAARIAFLLERPEEIAASSTTVISPDTTNLGSATMTSQPAVGETSGIAPLTDVLANNLSPVAAQELLRGGVIGSIPRGTKDITLASLATQATASIAAKVDADIGAFTLTLDGVDHSFAVQPSDVAQTSWETGAEIAKYLDMGVFKSSVGEETLADLGISVAGSATGLAFASDGSRSLTAASAVSSSGSSIGATVTQGQQASDIRVFTREGRQIAGIPLNTDEVANLLTVDNGFAREAEYRADYNSVTGGVGYRGIDVTQSQTASSPLTGGAHKVSTSLSAVSSAPGATLTLTSGTPGTSFTATVSGVGDAAAIETTTSNLDRQAVAQVDTITLSETFEPGDSITISGVANTDITYTVVEEDIDSNDTSQTLANIAAGLVQKVTDANGYVSAAASAGNGSLTLTATDPGTAFTATVATADVGEDDSDTTQTAEISTTTDNVTARVVAQVDTITLNGSFAVDDEITVDMGTAGSVTYKVTADDLTVNRDGTGGPASEAQAAINIAAKLSAVIDTAGLGVAGAFQGSNVGISSNSAVNRTQGQTITLDMATGFVRSATIPAGADAALIADRANASFAPVGVRAKAMTALRLSLDPSATDGSVQFDLGGLDGDPLTISAQISNGDLNALVSAVNRRSDDTGITAEVSLSGDAVTLVQDDGFDITISNISPNGVGFGAVALDQEFNPLNLGGTPTFAIPFLNEMRVNGTVSFLSSSEFEIRSDATGAETLTSAADPVTGGLVAREFSNGGTAASLVFNIDPMIDGPSTSVDGTNVHAPSSRYEAVVTADNGSTFTASVSAANLTPGTLSGDAVAQAMAAELRAQAPVPTLTGAARAIGDFPPAGTTSRFMLGGAEYTLTRVEGGDPTRLTALDFEITGPENGRLVPRVDEVDGDFALSLGVVGGQLSGAGPVPVSESTAAQFGLSTAQTTSSLQGRAIASDLADGAYTIDVSLGGVLGSVTVEKSNGGLSVDGPDGLASSLQADLQTDDDGSQFLVLSAKQTGLGPLSVTGGDDATALGLRIGTVGLTVDAGVLNARSTTASAIDVVAGATSTAGSYLRLSDLPDDELIVVMSDTGAKRIAAQFEIGSPTSAADREPENFRVEMMDDGTGRVELFDVETGASIATRTSNGLARFNVSGQDVELSGFAETGDTFTLVTGRRSPGDARNLDEMLNLGQQRTGFTSYQDEFRSIAAGIGATLEAARLTRTSNEAVYEAAVASESELSGVNLDEEAAKLIAQQQAYQAAARILQTAREMFDTLIRIP